MFRKPFIGLVLLLAVEVVRADEAEDRAVRAIKGLGGSITRKDKTPGSPVIGLRLWGPEIRDAELKELAFLKQLQSLNLSFTKVTGAELKNLAGLKQLQSLDLCGTQVTDAGLKELTVLKHLQTLDLNWTSVSDAGLKELATLKHLTSLELSGTQVTAAGLEELRRVLPAGCEIRHWFGPAKHRMLRCLPPHPVR